MRAAGRLDPGGVTALKRIDIGDVFMQRGKVALLFVLLVPLIVVVKNEGDDVVEIIDEAVRRGLVYEPVKPVVEAGKVVVTAFNLFQQFGMRNLERGKFLLQGRIVGLQ